MVVLMIVIVPIAIGVPAMIVFVPPPVIYGIAVLALLVQLVPPVVGFAAVRAVMLDGLVELVVNFRKTLWQSSARTIGAAVVKAKNPTNTATTSETLL